MSTRTGGLDGGGPPSHRGAATLNIVLTTSTQLFAERGFAATSMRELADRSGLPLSGFYYYFDRKYDVLKAIMDQAMGRLEAALDDVADDRLSASEQLTAFVRAHVLVHLARPAAAQVADGEMRALAPKDREAFTARRDAYERRFRDLLARGRESGEFPADLDIPVASMSILTMGTGVVYWWRPDGRLSAEHTAERMASYALAIARGASARVGDIAP
jgi:AcrR family transcriptional regulator